MTITIKRFIVILRMNKYIKTDIEQGIQYLKIAINNAGNIFQLVADWEAANSRAIDQKELNKLLCEVLEEQADTDEMYASELKGVLLRLRPDFNEKNYGCATFFKLLQRLSARYEDIKVKNDNFNVMVTMAGKADEDSGEAVPQITRENWREAFEAQLKAYKEGGFERINPSILKADILTTYPEFNERAIGFKRFSDVMKQLEKDGLVRIEMDDQRTMLLKLL